jgi:hypothetical protein
MKLYVLFFSVMLGFSHQGKSISISGEVSDNHQLPIPFCSVYLKGTTVGTTANIDGKFFLEVTPGNFEIVFRSIGYKLYSKQVTVTTEDIKLNVTLEPESYQLKEATVNASDEDPAYAIIRKAIKNRKKYLDETEAFTCKAYVKSTQKLTAYPKKFLGQDVNFGDYLDTVSKIFYLSESVANLSIQAPDKVKEEMISSKVSGNSRSFSFNNSSGLLVSFYNSLIDLGNLSPRGIVSPISGTAMMYYDYKLEGTFIQYGQTVNKIKVIPKRKHDPVFTGDIYILDDSWRIHSLDLYISKDQQIEFIDTFRISETYIPVEKEKWMMLNSDFNFEFSFLGFRGKGVILGVFSNYDIHPEFPKHYFDNAVMKINKDANKKDTVYWEGVRPVPLTLEENRDYVKRDSLFDAHNTKEYKDSVDKKNNKFSMVTFMLAGYRKQNTYNNSATTFSGLAQNLHFNTVEGWVLGLTARYDKSMGEEDRRSYSVIGEGRYGFSNMHFNGNLTFQHRYNPFRLSAYTIRAGTEVRDFNERAHFSRLVNTMYTLIGNQNYLKLYESRFGEVAHRMEIFNGIVARVKASYDDRLPLVNTTDYSWNDNGKKYLSNDPLHPETDSLHFQRNQSFRLDINVRIRYKQKYTLRPEGKNIIGSDYPQLSLGYTAAIPNVAGSDVDYGLATATVFDEIGFGLFGSIRYQATYGNFVRNKKMEFMDYHHFNGNRTIFSDFSLIDFGLLDYYSHATNRDYVEMHGEYNMGGLILNKIFLLRNLKLNEIIGAHYFHARYTGTSLVKNYYETSFGIEKFGLLRADFVLGFDDGNKARTGFLLGLKVNISDGSIRITD